METSIVETVILQLTNFISALGYPGIFFLMALESALIPVPSEVVMPFSGFLVARDSFSFWPTVLAGTFGNLAGALFAYALGYFGEDSIIHATVKKYGKYLLIKDREFQKAVKFLSRHGPIIVLISRFLPGIRAVISLPAGMAKVNLLKFSVFTLIGSFIWSLVLVYVGFVMGENWHLVQTYLHKFDLAIIVITIILISSYFIYKLSWTKSPRF